MKAIPSTANRFFGLILGLCLGALVVCGIAWAMGWDYGGIGIVVFGALANVPMFHFAMNWPLKKTKSFETDEKQ
ncbi:MAG: hypothetical protein KDN19_10830 [Verrucomicrobiae bacterium]|nr:hypothetical protein [Verrucomicrobiae bacterium]